LVGTGRSSKRRPWSSSTKTPSGTTRWKWTLRFTSPPNRCTKVTAPVRGVGRPRLRATRRCQAPMARTTSAPVHRVQAGLRASTSRSGLGTVKTHWR
jgi:hypothetical protein